MSARAGGAGAERDEEPGQEVRRLLARADDVHKASANRAEPSKGLAAVRTLLERAAAPVEQVTDAHLRDELLVQVGRRLDDVRPEDTAVRGVERPAGSVDGPALPQPGPSTLSPADRTGDDRVPPGQHVVRGLPVFHVGAVATLLRDDTLLAWGFEGSPPHRSTAGRSGSSCPPATSGSRPSGSSGCSCWTTTCRLLGGTRLSQRR